MNRDAAGCVKFSTSGPRPGPRLGRAIASLARDRVGSFCRIRSSLDLAHRPPRPLDPRAVECPPHGSPAGPAATRNRSSVMNAKATFRPHERLKDPKDFRRAYERRRSESDQVLGGLRRRERPGSLRGWESRSGAKRFVRLFPATGSSAWCAKHSACARPISPPESTWS